MEQNNAMIANFNKGDIVIVNENLNEYPRKDEYNMKIGAMLVIKDVGEGYIDTKDGELFYGVVYECSDGWFYKEKWLTLYQQRNDFKDF